MKKGATPSTVVYDEDPLKLWHYEAETPPKFATPLVFVFALVNRPYILDLMPGPSVVEHFVRAGFDTHMVDWGVPTHADRHLTLDSYVNGYLGSIVEHLQQLTGAPQANLFGYCIEKPLALWENLDHHKFVDEYLTMETWLNDNIGLARPARTLAASRRVAGPAQRLSSGEGDQASAAPGPHRQGTGGAGVGIPRCLRGAPAQEAGGRPRSRESCRTLSGQRAGLWG